MSKKKNKRKPKEIDYTAEGVFDKNRSIVYVEHTYECAIFVAKADEFVKYLEKVFPDRQFVLVRNGQGKIQPRPGSFEIEFSQHAKTSRHTLWSGIDKGPPRREKFPNFDDLLPEVQKILKKFYPDVITNVEDELNEDNN